MVIVVALSVECAGGDVGAVCYGPAESFKPLEGGMFDFGLGEGGHRKPVYSSGIALKFRGLRNSYPRPNGCTSPKRLIPEWSLNALITVS